MLQLRTLAPEYFDLDPRTSLNITMKAPIFDPEGIERIFSYPFVLPDTPKNVRLLKAAQRLDARINTTKIDVEILLEGQVFHRGFLRITGRQNNGIEVSFKNKSLDLAETLGKIRLRDISNIETVTDPFCPQLIIALVYPILTPITTNIALQINTNVYIYTIIQLDDLIAAIEADYPGIASEPVLGQAPNELLILFSCPPNPGEFNIYIRPAVPDPPNTLFFNVFASDYEDEADRITTDWATFLAAEGSAKSKYPVVFAPNLYDGKNTKFSRYANYVDADGVHPATGSDNTNDAVLANDPGGSPYYSYSLSQWPHTLLPFPVLRSVLDAIIPLVGAVSLTGTFVDDAEIADLILWNNTAIDRVISAEEYIVDFPATNESHIYEPEFDLKDLMPDISAMDLLKGLISMFCLYIRYEQGKIIINPCRDALTAKPEEWTAYAEPSYNQDIPESVAYTLDYNRQGDDTNLVGQLQRVNGGTDAQDFISQPFTLHYRLETDPLDTDRAWNIPIISEKGTSSYYKIANKASFRLLFYRGMQPDSGGNDYPFASHSNLNLQGESVGNYSLDWQGPNGLYEKWWKEYIHLRTHGRPLKMRFRLSVDQLIDLSRWRKGSKVIYTEFGQVTGIIQSIQFRATPRGVSIADVELITL